MALALPNIVVALFLGYGAIAELWVRGVRGGETQPALVGAAGILVSFALTVCGVGRLRRWESTRQLTTVTAVALVTFHVYAALPPHRNVGILVALVAAMYGSLLLGVSLAGRGGAKAAHAAG